LGPDELCDSALRSKVNTLQSKNGESTPFGFSASAYRSEIIDKFEKLLIETTTGFDTKCHKGVSLGLDLLLPFVVFEFGAVVICCTWDCSSFSATFSVTGIRGANIRNNYVLVWQQRSKWSAFVDYDIRSHAGRPQDKDIVFLFFGFQAHPSREPAHNSAHGIMP